MKTALVCIAKNEENYIEEWLRYNIKLGFNHIFIFQNDWIANIPIDIIEKNIVTCIDWPTATYKHSYNDINPQLAAYNFFIEKFYHEYDWAAFFDVDEFLLLKNATLDEFLFKYSACNAISIFWRLFGDNKLKQPNETYSCINRFVRSAAVPCNNTKNKIKTIVNLKKSKNTIHIIGHITSPILPTYINPCEAELAHYMVKTWPEFLQRRTGKENFFYGKRDAFEKSDIISLKKFFDGKNKNDIENYSVFNFYHNVQL